MVLKEICDVYSGYALKSFNESRIGYPVIKIGNILTDGSLELKECQYTDQDINEKYFSQKGDIYIALSGATTGKIGIMCTSNKYVINQRVGVVRKRDENIPQDFLKYFLLRQTDRILQEASGCAQPNISPKQIAEYEVPQLSRSKMLEIVGILDRLTNVIKQRKEELKLLDECVNARFVEMFGTPTLNDKGWNVVSADECCKVITDGSHFSPPGQDEGYPMLSVKDMRNDGFHYESCKKISEEDFKVLKKQGCIPQKNDVLVSKDGSYFYYGFVLNEYKEQAILSSIAMLRPDLNLVNPYYLCNYMLTEQIVRLVEQNYVTGAALKRVILKGIKKIPVMIPPIELQNQFADFVHQVDKSKVASYNQLKNIAILLAICSIIYTNLNGNMGRIPYDN